MRDDAFSIYDRKKPIKFAGLAALFGLAITIILTGLSERATRIGQYLVAVQLPGASGAASAKLAANLYTANKTILARTMAMAALDKSLGHVEAIRTMGMIEHDRGNRNRSRKLMVLAGQLSWRDSQTQAWLFQQSLEQARYGDAIIHADALLRRRQVTDEIFGVFRLAALDPKLAIPIKQQFEKRPKWRVSFFRMPKGINPQEIEGFENLVRNLRKSTAPVSREELSPFVHFLANEGQRKRGLNLWNDLFPEDGAKAVVNEELSLIWPSGDRRDKPYPVDWRFVNSRTVFLSTEEITGSGQPVLRVEIDRRAAGNIALRNIILPKGRLSLTVDSSSQHALNNFTWFVNCVDGKQRQMMIRAPTGQNHWVVDIDGNCSSYQIALAVRSGGLSSSETIQIGQINLSMRKK